MLLTTINMVTILLLIILMISYFCCQAVDPDITYGNSNLIVNVNASNIHSFCRGHQHYSYSKQNGVITVSNLSRHSTELHHCLWKKNLLLVDAILQLRRRYPLVLMYWECLQYTYIVMNKCGHTTVR